MRVAVIDIGKPGKNLGWAMDQPDLAGVDLDECVGAIAAALRIGPVALGFEAPQFVPLRDDPMVLTAGRTGEFGPGQPTRTFSASAGVNGACHIASRRSSMVLTGLRARVVGGSATFGWKRPISEPGELLLFEAFVTDQRKDAETRHVEDARLAIADFRRGISDPESFESSVTSLHRQNA